MRITETNIKPSLRVYDISFIEVSRVTRVFDFSVEAESEDHARDMAHENYYDRADGVDLDWETIDQEVNSISPSQ